MVALLLMGSAILLSSCKGGDKPQPINTETLITSYADSLSRKISENGKVQYYMEAAMVEAYELAREPYTEFRKGIYVENYKDSTGIIQSTIRADYAINYDKREFWEARGNVVVTGEDGRTLYTEQLFWDRRGGRIYSNVYSTIVQERDVFHGERFESDDKLEQWRFFNYTGTVVIEDQQAGGGQSSSGSPAETTPTGDTTDREDQPAVEVPAQQSGSTAPPAQQTPPEA